MTPRFWLLQSCGAALISAGFFIFSEPTIAQNDMTGKLDGRQCGSHEEMVELLRDEFEEIERGGGFLRSPSFHFSLDLFTSYDGATWTFLLTDEYGRSCLSSFGTDWADKS